MKIEVSIGLLKDFFANCESCNHCIYKGTKHCFGKDCTDAKTESLIEKSKLVLDFDLALIELEKLKKKCTEKQIAGLSFATETLEEIKKEFQ